MRFLIVILFFLTGLPGLATENFGTENCSHSTEGSHNVEEESYKRLLAKLSGGEARDKKRSKGEKRELEGGGSGQR